MPRIWSKGAVSSGGGGEEYKAGEGLEETGSKPVTFKIKAGSLVASMVKAAGGILLASNNLSDVETVGLARSNLQVPIYTPATVVSTSNITLSGTQTIDGVALVEGNLVLVTGQSTPSENGEYEVKTGGWVRTKEMSAGTEIKAGRLAPVVRGTAYELTLWELYYTVPITVGMTAQIWKQTTANYTARLPIVLTGGSQIEIKEGSITSSYIENESLPGGPGGSILKESITALNIAPFTLTGTQIKGGSLPGYLLENQTITKGLVQPAETPTPSGTENKVVIGIPSGVARKVVAAVTTKAAVTTYKIKHSLETKALSVTFQTEKEKLPWELETTGLKWKAISNSEIEVEYTPAGKEVFFVTIIG